MSHKVPLTAPGAGYLRYRDEIDAAVRRVLESGWYILGKEVEAFERAFAAYCGVSAVVGVGNGTDAIALALRALGIGPGDAVFTVSHTAVATVAAIEMAQAAPVLVDVDPQTYTLDLQKLADSIQDFARSGRAGRPRAVIAVHLYGHPADLTGLRELCDRHGLFLIEDCAQAHGARYAGRPVGSVGDASAFSFYPTKNLPAFGDGGAVAFADEAAARRCRALREYGWYHRYLSDVPGVNSRLDELHAAILSVRLHHLDEEVAQRQAIARLYDEALPRDFVAIPAVRRDCQHAYHLYVVRSAARDALRDALSAQGIGTGVHYPQPVHLQNAYRGRVALGAGGMAVTEQLASQVLSLPMHPFLSRRDVAAVIDAVRSCALARQSL